MFRISQYIKELHSPTGKVRTNKPSGPVVIWNLIRRCNLTCKHCYATAADIDFPGELKTQEVFTVMDDLKSFGVPVLIISGGEPLMRPDIFDISKRAKGMGFYVGLSSNGTLIDDNNIRDIVDIEVSSRGIILQDSRGLSLIDYDGKLIQLPFRYELVGRSEDNPVLMWSGGTNSSLRCLCMTADGVEPSNGTLPVTMWYRVAPSE